eukprot:TRINITY_DN11587_c0_g1_i1.p1 TRINITY_DN11587_c0_g1~~TRINITY_DN11587_c0_g1_i1.p1  ORF type:complete len:208 (+),score=38.42 TRINITY_DN11587_c0_g1_i1:29-625(+)
MNAPLTKEPISFTDLVVGTVLSTFYLTVALVDVSFVSFAASRQDDTIISAFVSWRTYDSLADVEFLQGILLVLMLPLPFMLYMELKAAFILPFYTGSTLSRHLLDIISAMSLCCVVTMQTFRVDPAIDSIRSLLSNTHSASEIATAISELIHFQWIVVALNIVGLIVPFLKNPFTTGPTPLSAPAAKKNAKRRKKKVS